jgi:UDP-2-acetamido-3-amino-2,3-dideoxy-glucuronate N-acetyltransferase
MEVTMPFDQELQDHPEFAVGFDRHVKCVEKVKSNGGTVYMAALSNIQSFHIGREAKIHSHVWIGRRAEIGINVLIQAFAFIPDGVILGDNVFIGPHACFTNDKKPPSNSWLATVVENNVSIGANATILPGVRLGEGCVVGAGAVVTKDIPPGETWVGNPARKLGGP